MMQKRFAVLLLIFAFVFSSSAAVYSAEKTKTPDQLIKESKAMIKEVSVEDAKKMMDNKEPVIYLDVRDKEEYEKGHLPGAINMSRGLLDFHVQEIIPDKNAKIVVV
ncbi:MAG: rhodanese-like domain-containing protein [Thermodesulfovibrionales bacterium]